MLNSYPLVEINPVVKKKSFKEKVTDGQTHSDHYILLEPSIK